MIGFLALGAELEWWASRGHRPRMWWRDDDAICAEPALLRLVDLSQNTGVPLALAVIPAGADATLRSALTGLRGISVLQHGFDHLDHGPPGQPTQFAADRPVSEVAAIIREGADRLKDWPGWRPIYVPPWNRVEDNVLAALPLAGIRGLSAFGQSLDPSRPLVRCDAHVDVLRWRGQVRFGGALRTLDRLRRALVSRRRHGRWADPVGILTHHRVHDAAAWGFLERLLDWPLLADRVQWCSAQTLFAADLSSGPHSSAKK